MKQSRTPLLASSLPAPSSPSPRCSARAAASARAPTTRSATSSRAPTWYSSYFMVGDLAEVIIYDRSLSDSERMSASTYLQNKYFN